MVACEAGKVAGITGSVTTDPVLRGTKLQGAGCGMTGATGIMLLVIGDAEPSGGPAFGASVTVGTVCRHHDAGGV